MSFQRPPAKNIPAPSLPSGRGYSDRVIEQGAGSRTVLRNRGASGARWRSFKARQRRQGANRRDEMVSEFGPSAAISPGKAEAIEQAENLTSI